MGRRKKKPYDYDGYEDYLDEEAMAEQAQPEVAKVSLKDFMVPEKVSAFVNDYEPCDEFDPGAERFDDGRLREYFKAYVCGLGDPLSLYIEPWKSIMPEPFMVLQPTSLAILSIAVSLGA